MANTKINTKITSYIVPDPRSIDDFARTACKHFAQDDLRFSSPEVASGLAAFLAIVAEIVAKHLNEHGDEFLDRFLAER